MWRRFDRARSRAELESLLAAQRPDGFIGHTIFWHRPVSGWRRLFYNVRDRSALTTETIQPPLLAWAWRIAVGDPAAEPRIARPRTTGWPPTATSRATACCGSCSRTSRGSTRRRSSTPCGAGARTRGSASRCWCAATARLDWDARAVLDAGGPVLCEVVVNVLWCLSRLALGRPSITPALVERLWDERRGLFLDEAQPGGLRARRRDRRPRWRRWRCPTCPRRSAAGWSRSTCSTRSASGSSSRRRRSPRRSPRSSPARAAAPCAATGAARRGSTPRGCVWLGLVGSATTTQARRARVAPARPDRARGPARVLRPPHRRRPRRQGLRLVEPRGRARRPGGEPPRSCPARTR